MKLTGIAKERFEEWYLKTQKHFDSLTVLDGGKLNQLYRLNESGQNALIIDFFDEYDILIFVNSDCLGWNYEIDLFNELNPTKSGFKTRPEAIESAIIKANELFNELNKQER